MAFKGDLSTIGLSEVFQMISMAGKEGTLLVQDADSRKCIYFGADGIQLLSMGKRKGLKLGELLVRSGILGENQLQSVLEGQKGAKKLLGEALIESGTVTEEDIRRVVRSQIEEEIYDLFLWKKATFEFVEGPPAPELQDPDSQATKLGFDVNSLLLEAVRRADEWNVINAKIPSLDTVFVFQSEEVRSEEFRNAPLHRILAPINGQATLQEVIDTGGGTKFEVCKAVVDLLVRDRLRPVGADEILEFAQVRIQEGRREMGLKLLKIGLSQAPQDSDLLLEYARALEKEGQGVDAAAAYFKVGSLMMEQGRDSEARVYFLRSQELNPQDSASARMASVAGGTSVHTLDPVERALLRKDYERAREQCEEILRREPKNLDARTLLVRIFQETGQTQRRDEQLGYLREHVAPDTDTGRWIARRLKEILPAEPSAPGTTRWSPGRKKGRKVVGAVAAVFLALLIGAAIKYEFDARDRFHRHAVLADLRVREKQYAQAIQALEEFRTSPYRFSPFVSKQLDEKTASVRAAWDVDLRTAQTRGEVQREKVLTDLRRRLDTIRKWMEEGDWGKAHRGITDLVASARQERAQDYVQEHRGVVVQIDAFLDQCVKVEEKIWVVVDTVRSRKRVADTSVKDGKFREAAVLYDELLRDYPRYVVKEELEFPVRILARPDGTKIVDDRRGELGVAKAGQLVVPLRHKESLLLRFSLRGYRTKGPVRVEYDAGESPEVVLDEKGPWSPAWPWTPFEKPVEWSPVHAAGLIFVVSGRTLYGIRSSETATLDWQLAHTKAILGAPVEIRGRILYGSGERALHVVDAVQRKDARIPLGKEMVGSPGVSSDGRFVAVGTADRFVTVLDLEAAPGREIVWERRMPDDVRGQPVVDAGIVFVRGGDSFLRAVRGPAESDLLWTYAPGTPLTSPVLAEGKIFVGREDGKVVALDLEGKELWGGNARGPVVAPPTVGGGMLYAVTLTGTLMAFSTGSGTSWSWPSDGKPVKPIRASAVVARGRVLVPSEDRLYAVDADTGKLRWSFSPKEGAKFLSSPLVVGNVAYLGATDKSLYAVELD